MSAKVLTIPGRLVECAGGCGALVVGEFVCANCRAFDDDLREKARARLFRQMARYELGLTPFAPPPPPVPRRPWSVRAALACVLLGSTGIVVMVIAEAVHLGKLAIVWLCGVSA